MYVPHQPAYGPPVSGPGVPGAGYPVTGLPTAGLSGGGQADRPRRGGWVAIFALVLAFLLAVVAGVEGFAIYRLDGQLADANRRVTAEQGGDDKRLDQLEGRASELEKRVGSAFDPAAVAAAVLPSVFRVTAGNFSGTAFAVGRQTSGGGTYLFTNYHVVEQVWASGKRQVALERRDQRFNATIAKIDKSNDVALLETTQKFPRLAVAGDKVKSGEPVVVIGAPLGLEDSVTTGVVSAIRKIPDFPGDTIQFSAPINPGNSGGPVINSQKQVVGIASAKARDAEGIGLAVPIATACSLLQVC
jgi:S1-C subfamily serine protease